MDNTEAIEKVAKLILKAAQGVQVKGPEEWATIRAQAILAAFQADPLAYVKPKPLEWRTDPLDVTVEVFGIEDFYSIRTLCGFYLSINGEEWGSYLSLEAAQAAAETHRNEMLAKEFEQ